MRESSVARRRMRPLHKLNRHLTKKIIFFRWRHTPVTHRLRRPLHPFFFCKQTEAFPVATNFILRRRIMLFFKIKAANKLRRFILLLAPGPIDFPLTIKTGERGTRLHEKPLVTEESITPQCRYGFFGRTLTALL